MASWVVGGSACSSWFWDYAVDHHPGCQTGKCVSKRMYSRSSWICLSGSPCHFCFSIIQLQLDWKGAKEMVLCCWRAVRTSAGVASYFCHNYSIFLGTRKPAPGELISRKLGFLKGDLDGQLPSLQFQQGDLISVNESGTIGIKHKYHLHREFVAFVTFPWLENVSHLYSLSFYYIFYWQF